MKVTTWISVMFYRHALRILLLFLTSIFFLKVARAEEISIIQVRKNIPLSDDEPSYRDLFLNAGEGSGIKKGQTYVVLHRFQVKDSSGAQSFGEIEIPVAEVKILAVFARVSVAREVKVYPREEYPILDIFGIMAGDRLELKR